MRRMLFGLDFREKIRGGTRFSEKISEVWTTRDVLFYFSFVLCSVLVIHTLRLLGGVDFVCVNCDCYSTVNATVVFRTIVLSLEVQMTNESLLVWHLPL